jgi:membrane-bound serine protease (ClpP class)
MSVKQRILDTLMDPNISFLLLAAGALFIYLEFHTPSAIIPGVIGFIAVLLAIFALHLLPTSYAAIAMILGAFVLFALEAKFASHGALTLGGTALLILGALMLVDGPIPQMRVRLITAVAVGIPFAFITAFLMNIALRARRNKVAIGQEALIGQTAVVRSPLTPEGKVVVMGELWNAVSSAPADVGSRVRIRSVDGLKLEVEPDASVSTPTK